VNYKRVFWPLFNVEIVVGAGVMALVLLLLLYAVIFRRQGARRKFLPNHNMKLEIGYMVVLAGVVGFFVSWSISAYHKEQSPPVASPTASSAPAENIHVVAYRWCWEFDYQNHPIKVTDTCKGRNHDPVMVVPTGRPVHLTLTSKDVIHQFWIPELDIKRENFPTHANYLHFTFTHPGKWIGRCAVYCGTYHSMMDFYVRAVPPRQYAQWVAAHSGAAA
jgi:cytochrome c oxidase subunit 2